MYVLILHVCLCGHLCMPGHVGDTMHVWKSKDSLQKLVFPIPPRDSWGLNSDLHVWWQSPLSAEPSHQLFMHCLMNLTFLCLQGTMIHWLLYPQLRSWMFLPVWHEGSVLINTGKTSILQTILSKSLKGLDKSHKDADVKKKVWVYIFK